MVRTKVSHKKLKWLKAQEWEKTGNSVFNICQPCSSYKFEQASIQFLIHAKIMFRTKISHKIDKNATKSQELVKTGNSGFRIWQPCSSEKYDKASYKYDKA